MINTNCLPIILFDAEDQVVSKQKKSLSVSVYHDSQRKCNVCHILCRRDKSCPEIQQGRKTGQEGCSFNTLAGATVTDFPVTSESGINVSH